MSQDKIDGKRALTFVAREPGEDGRILPPAEYEVHMSPASDLTTELIYPTGPWFAPPRGVYRTWIEGDDAMSRATLNVAYARTPFDGKGIIVGDTVHPAGRIALGRGVEVDLPRFGGRRAKPQNG